MRFFILVNEPQLGTDCMMPGPVFAEARARRLRSGTHEIDHGQDLFRLQAYASRADAAWHRT
jgi:hypothetical protein